MTKRKGLTKYSTLLAEASMRHQMAERHRLLHEARRLRDEIRQIYTDAASWNENTRRPGEAAIDPDPDGQLWRIAEALDALLARDGAPHA